MGITLRLFNSLEYFLKNFEARVIDTFVIRKRFVVFAQEMRKCARGFDLVEIALAFRCDTLPQCCDS